MGRTDNEYIYSSFIMKDMYRDLFYSNTYPDDVGKASHMGTKVKYDLKPFSEYLSKSIDNLMKAAEVRAECSEVRQRVILRPQSTLLRVAAREEIVVEKPHGNYYIIDWDSEWGDIGDFDALTKGRTLICESDSIVDAYFGSLLIKTTEKLDTASRYKVFLKDSDDDHDCSIHDLNYNDIQEYRIECGNAKLISARINGDTLMLHYSGATGSSVRFFSQVKKNIIGSKTIDLSRMNLSMQGAEVAVWNAAEGVVVAHCPDEDVTSLFGDEAELAYSIVDKEEMCSLLNDPDIVFKDKKIEIINNAFGDVGNHITLRGLNFKVSESTKGIKRRLGANSIIVELAEDDSFKDDVYSNTSYFFKETTEYVRDAKKRVYKIGNKYENFNQIEIGNVDGKKIQDIPAELYIVPNKRQLQMQLNALKALLYKPCRAHAPLLELMNEKKHSSWGEVPYQYFHIREWYRLKDEKYEGCVNQREFVKKALATPDFAILEGPPGSGKTTTILEIIAQMIMRGQKVILAASTNAAIDNILERITDLPRKVQEKMLAVRIGNESAISESVREYTLFDMDEDTRDEIISRANLVCGTIIGILQHPEFNLKNTFQPTIPLYDALIIDEASKTTFQEFLVPAVYAKKWILSGDLKQLTPYIEQDSIASSLTQIEKFDIPHQRAQAILMELNDKIYKTKDPQVRQLKFCVPVESDVLRAMSDLIGDYPDRRIALMGNVTCDNGLAVENFIAGKPKALMLVYGSDLLFIERDSFGHVGKYIPESFVPLLSKSAGFCDFQSNAYYKNFHGSVFNTKAENLEDLKDMFSRDLKDKTWASEIAWRLCRIQELFLLSQLSSGDEKKTNAYKKQIEERIPAFVHNEVQTTIDLIQEIALPSIIQLLQRGVGDNVVKNIKSTTLNKGFDETVLWQRHTILEYQHRMHDEISAFPAKYIYEGSALHNGRSIDRDWQYTRYPRRAFWLNVVPSTETQTNKNPVEVSKIVGELKEFVKFARTHKRSNGEPWTVACLTYYRAQESELKKAIKKMLGSEHVSSYYKIDDANLEIVVYTVDKFQGNEADVVFLSMIKSGNVGLGFMDSPNRLNVAMTRAKYQVVIVGDEKYFKSNRCKSQLLRKVVEEYSK